MSKPDPMIGRILSGTIEIRRKIGAGGMGSVYEGFQEHLGRVVAVKVMTPEHARNPVAAEYFLREARATSQLRHPNIIQIIDYGTEDDSTVFIAMEFVPGKPLTKLIRHEFPLDPNRVIRILDQTLAGLAEAHRKQLIHRDLKPDNLMIERIDNEDFVKVLDFGIAQSQAPEHEAGPLTQAGAVVGTPQYMSPEQATASGVDGRSDLFSLGVILYEMLTQEAPFRGKSLPEILIAVMRHHPQPPSVLRPDLSIDPGLEAICRRAMKKEVDLRYQSADEFRVALKELGSLQQPKLAAPTAGFIFKRSKSKVRTRAFEPKKKAGTPKLPGIGHEPTEAPATLVPDDPVGTLVEFSSAKEEPSATPGLGISVEELAGDLLGERAIVTALVLHQRSHRRIDPESMSELRSKLDAAVQAVATQWGARLLGRQGSFITLLFGVPTPTPDDSFRGVQAALSLRRSLRDFLPEGTVFGYALSSGEVYCPSGDVSQAAGDPIDFATEAARMAGDDNVVTADDALSVRLSTMFRLGPEDDEGHRAVLGVLDVGRQAHQHAESSDVDLIGRDAEIATLLSAQGRLSKGRGSMLLISGDAGVGKSAMIDEAVRLGEQRGALVLRARYSGEGPEAIRDIRLQWLLDYLRHSGHLPADAQLAFRETGLAREYCRLLAGFINDRLEDAFGFVGRARRTPEGDLRAEEALRVAMRRLCRVLTNDRPLVLVVDDVQSITDTTQEFLQRWTDTTSKQSLLFLVGIRSRTGESLHLEGPVEQMALEPLEEPAALAFLKVRLPSTVPANVITRLARIGAGFPAHLEHLARFARARNFDADEADEMLASTRDIAELMRMRVYELPKPHQNVLAVLSALGDAASPDVLIDLARADWEPDQALEDLVADGLLETSGPPENLRLHFRPPTLQHVIYDRLSRKMRHQIHARAAAHFEERVRAARPHPFRDDLLGLARHRELGGDASGALKVLRGLADRAYRETDYDGARQVLERAIKLLENDPEPQTTEIARLELQLLRADAAVGDKQAALDRCRKLDRMDGLDRPLALEIRLELAKQWLAEEDPELVGRIVRTVLTEVRKLQAQDPDSVELRCLLVVSLQLSAKILERQKKLVRAMEQALESAAIIERGELAPLDNPWGPALVWETLNQVGRIRLRLGEIDGARKMFKLAHRVVDDCDDRRGQVAVEANMSSLYAADGNIELAYKSISNALRTARSLGDPHTISKLEYNRGLILKRQKRLEMAEQAFDESLSLAEDLDWREGIAEATSQLAALRELRARQGKKSR